MVRTEEDTQPIAIEEEIAKLVAIMIIAQTEQYVSDRQWAYQRGRLAGDVACMLTMLLDHTREQGSSMVVYKLDLSNAYSTVDLAEVAHLLQEAGVDPPKARWYQRYVQWAQIVSVTAASTTRARRFRVGVFQGSPLGPRVYLYQEVRYMEAVGPGHTGTPSVWNDGVELAFNTERYSDDAVVLATTEEALVAMLSQQDAVASNFRVRHVPSKEEYLYITWSGQAGATKASIAQRRDKRRGIWVLGNQVLSEAAGTGLRRRVRGAVAEWATATIHLAAVQDVVRVFTEQVLAQVVARTRGALPSEKDVYRLAAPMGRVWRRKIQVHFKLGSAAVATGHEHDAASTVNVVHSSVAPTRSRRDRKRAAESAQRDWLGGGRRDGGAPPARRQADATAPVGHMDRHSPRADVAVYTDAGARQDLDEERGWGVGLVIRVSNKWWGAAVPLQTWVDNTTAELLGVVLGRYVVERLRDLGARTIEQTYDAQAAAALAEKPPEQQKHPLRRRCSGRSVRPRQRTWWVKSHQEVSALTSHNDVRKMGNILANAQATEAVDRSAKG